MKQSYALIIPSWYPSPKQKLAGIFIQKHVKLISRFYRVQVLHAIEHAGGPDYELVNDYEHIFYYKPGFIKQFNYLLCLWRGFLKVKKERGLPSVIHLQVAYPACIIALFVSQLYNVPLIISEHWSGYTKEDNRYAKLSLLMKWFMLASFMRAKKISVVSEYLKTAIVESGLAPANKMMLVHNVLNPPTKLPEAKTIDVTPIKALTIANLNDHEKNISLLIEALALVVQKVPDFSITIIGGGDEKAKFEALARSKNLSAKNICFAGYISNDKMNEQYGAHHFYILTSNFETFGIAAAEAVMNGLPVVSTHCGGPEEFLDNTNSIFTESISAEKIAEAILLMIEQLDTFNKTEIAKAIAAKFTDEKVIAELKNLYQISR